MAGKIQNADIKSEAELVGLGADKTQLLNTTKMYSPKTTNVLENDLRKNNDAAIGAPTTSNDNTQGYEVGSRWVDTVGQKAYVCISATTGAAIWKAIGGGLTAWVTATAYKIGDIVIESNRIYKALTDHTAGTFATDLTNNEWVELSASEVVDLTTDVTGILPIANGGTGLSTSGASGNILTSDGTNWVSMPVAGVTTYNATLSNGLIYPIWDFTNPTKLANPATLPTGTGNGTAWSPDGQFLTVVHNTTPFITIYQRNGTTFTKLANPVTLPPDVTQGTAWSPDGQFLTVTHNTTPFITIYQRNGTTFTKLANPATLPTSNGRGTAWSPDGQFLTVTNDTTPFITIYQRSGTTFTKLANPATLPTGNGRGTAWSPDGQFLTVAHFTTPFITIYERSGTTFTKLADPATLPTSNGWGTAWSPDGQFLIVAHSTTPFITIYRTSSDTPSANGSPVTTTVINREIR